MEAKLSRAPYQTFWNQSPEFQSHDDWPTDFARPDRLLNRSSINFDKHTELPVVNKPFSNFVHMCTQSLVRRPNTMLIGLGTTLVHKANKPHVQSLPVKLCSDTCHLHWKTASVPRGHFLTNHFLIPFSQNISKSFSELKLVADNLLTIIFMFANKIQNS